MYTKDEEMNEINKLMVKYERSKWLHIQKKHIRKNQIKNKNK